MINTKIIGHEGSEFPRPTMENPWWHFFDELEKGGCVINSNSNDEKIDLYITNSDYRKERKKFFFREIPIRQRIRILWEPEIVDQKNFYGAKKRFGRIFCPSVIWAERLMANDFLWPQGEIQFTTEDFEKWEKRDDHFVMVQGNKFSAHVNEMYSFRREILSVMDHLPIDLFGTDWNRGLFFDIRSWLSSVKRTQFESIRIDSLRYFGKKHKAYKGSPKNKFEVMSKYRYAIVIENSLDFLSEKLFDAASAGCICIYVGPNLEKFGINPNSFILSEPNLTSFAQTIENLSRMTNSEKKDILDQQNSELTRVYSLFENKKIFRELARDILKYSDVS